MLLLFGAENNLSAPGENPTVDAKTTGKLFNIRPVMASTTMIALSGDAIGMAMKRLSGDIAGLALATPLRLISEVSPLRSVV